MRPNSIAVLAALLLLTTLPPRATAQSDRSTADGNERVVAIREAPPFSIPIGT